jgi:NhaP-type Na+/H+ or K+/H+ antiporter
VAVGLVSLATLEMVRRRVGVRRDYESLYSLGVAFAAYAAAESVHGSGFLAAFAAGLTIAAFDVELCECFKEYGETTAELALLLTFVLLGSSLIWTGVGEASLASLAFAVLVLLGRPLVYYLALAAGRVDPTSRHLVAWFGPRGLSSLLLVLLPVFAGTPGSEELFRVTCLVVLLSVLLHGGALAWLARRGEPEAATTEPGSVLIRADELATLRAAGEKVVVLDARAEAEWERRTEDPPEGVVRIAPDRPLEHVSALGLPPDAWLVLYCT